MTAPPWTVRALRAALAAGTTSPSQLVESALANANRNASRNTYLWQDPAWTRAEAARAESMTPAIPESGGGPFGDGRSALWGLPISVKDCFDLAGSPTSCGVHFYRDTNGEASRDSWLVEQLRAAGAVITGKTHLHPLAYGITGENPEFGDCVQPRDPGALTGGSSSGAAASVQEGSAVAAIGTDTGGSIRAPAALCGLAGYRATIGRGNWRGAAHLAESFDTMGWLFRDLQDAPLLAAPFAPAENSTARGFTHFAFVDDSFLHDCEPEVVASFRGVIRELEDLGLEAQTIETGWWADAIDIYAPLQAVEAARIHAGNFDHFAPDIRDRLKWGTGLTPSEVSTLRQRLAAFRARMDELFAAHQLILLPSIPVGRLAAGADHSQTRMRLLRYTAPFSLAGVPTVVIPCAHGGMQLAAARGNDEALLALAAQIGAPRKTSVSV
ncbi:MAG: amidase [Terracidiphilus sp.]|jgi:aspartyl-tRNA(Asn)/glutamyl-tRNA(Gln) amidotransferase subunit A